LKSPPWGNLFMVMWVFGGASWIYSIPYLELEIRTAGTR
jgi:hypothetical protein